MGIRMVKASGFEVGKFYTIWFPLKDFYPEINFTKNEGDVLHPFTVRVMEVSDEKDLIKGRLFGSIYEFPLEKISRAIKET